MYIIYKRIVLCYIFIYNKINIKPNDVRHAILFVIVEITTLRSGTGHSALLGAHAPACCTKSGVDRVYPDNARFGFESPPPSLPPKECASYAF